MLRLAVLTLIACLSCGCVSRQTQIVNWNQNIAIGSLPWAKLAEQRFHGPVVLLSCHGATYHGVWSCFPDWNGHRPIPVETAAKLMRDLSNGRPVILLVCNEGGETLHVHGVFYSKTAVWTIPGPRSRPWMAELFGEEYAGECAGSMSDFVEGN